MKSRLSLIIPIILLTLFQSGSGFALEAKTSSFSLSSGKKTVTYVSFKANEALELKPVLAQNRVGAVEDLSQMAKRHQAVAAINGTFFNPYDNKDLQPLGAIMINNQLQHFRGGPVALGITPQNQLVFSNTNDLHIRGSINGSREWPNNWYAWFMNHSPSSQNEIIVFTQTIALDVPAEIINGRTMVPARFVSEALGAQVAWDQGKSLVVIETN